MQLDRLRVFVLAATFAGFPQKTLTCDPSTNQEVESTLAAMNRTLRLFYDAPSAVTVDVALGLIIGSQLLRVSSKYDNRWATKLAALRHSSDGLVQGFLGNRFGNHDFSRDLIPLMLNPALWQKVVQPLKREHFRITREDYFQKKNLWQELYNTQNIEIRPSSDFCLWQLFVNNCWVRPECLFGIGGDDLLPDGFERTHLLLFLQIASALECSNKNSLFSEEFLSLSRASLCRSMLHHAQKKPSSIADLDLLMEEITLCGLEGLIEFSGKDIRQNVTAFEKNGCFLVNETMTTKKNNKRNDSVIKGQCHTHTAAVGFAAYAVFLRTLLSDCR